MERLVLACNKCPKKCSLTCLAQDSEKEVEVILVLDKDVDFRFLTSFVDSFTQKDYAIVYAHNFHRKDFNCTNLCFGQLDFLKAKAFVLLGNSIKYFKPIFLNEYDSRGNLEDLTICDITYPAIQTLSPSTVMSSPNLLGIWKQDIERMFVKELRNLKIKDGDYKIINTVSEVKDFLNYLQYETKSNTVAMDLETKNLNKRFGNQLSTLQFSDDGKLGYVIPYEHFEASWSVKEQQQLKKRLIKLFTEDTVFPAWVVHGGKFEATQIFAKFGVIPKQYFIDTICGLWLLEENRLSLGKDEDEDGGNLTHFTLEKCYLEFGYDKYKGLKEDLKQIRSSGNLYKLPLKQLAPYGARDVTGDYQLFAIQRKIAKYYEYDDKWLRLLKHYYSPVTKMFGVMEYNGAQIDLEQVRILKSKNSPINLRLREIEKEFQRLPSVAKFNKQQLDKSPLKEMNTLFSQQNASFFNVNEAISKRGLFFDVLKLKPLKFGKPERKTVKEGCDHDFEITKDKMLLVCSNCGATCYGNIDKEFQKQYKDVPEVKLFVEYSSLKKLVTSYINKLYAYVDPENGDEDCQDGRVRSDNGIIKTVTARTTSQNPNSQQIPKAKTPTARAIKDLYCSDDILVQMDFRTAEVRVLGIVAKDKNLADLYNKSYEMELEFLKNPTPEKEIECTLMSDIHKQTASLMFEVPVVKIDDEQRGASKGIVFGLLYGLAVASLARTLKKTVDQAQKLFNKFFEKFSDSQIWINWVHAFVRKNSYVENPLGLRRHLPAFMLGTQEKHQSQAIRQSVNAVIQGTSAQLAMIGISLLNEYIIKNNLHVDWRFEISNFIHDALVFSVKKEHAKEAILLAKEFLTNKCMAYATEKFGMEFNLRIDVEVEIGKKLGSLKKWNNTDAQFDEIMEKL